MLANGAEYSALFIPPSLLDKGLPTNTRARRGTRAALLKDSISLRRSTVSMSAVAPEIVEPVRVSFIEWLRNLGGVAIDVRQHREKVQEICPGAHIDESVLCYRLHDQLRFVRFGELSTFDIEQPGLQKPSKEELYRFFEQAFPSLEATTNKSAPTTAKRQKKGTKTDRPQGRRPPSVALRH